MARPKINPLIKLTKRFNELQIRNEKLQADISKVLDEITKELENQVPTTNKAYTPIQVESSKAAKVQKTTKKTKPRK